MWVDLFVGGIGLEPALYNILLNYNPIVSVFLSQPIAEVTSSRAGADRKPLLSG